MVTCIPIDSKTDFDKWSELWKGYLHFYETTLPLEQYHNTFSRLVDEQGDLFGFILEDDDGVPIGLAHYLYHVSAWSSKPQCYLNDLFVDPARRGTGGGRLLIEAVKRQADSRGCSRLYWLTAPDNAAARKLYDKVATMNRVAYKIDL